MEGIVNELQDLIRQMVLFTPRAVGGLLVLLVFWITSVVFKFIICRIGKIAFLRRSVVFNLVGQSMKVILIILGVVMALGAMGINVTALVAGLGLTGFALGFALRDILSNVLAGALILIYSPFQLNDRISTGGLEGIVVEIDLRYTTLQSEDRRFLIPNSTLFTSAIHVLDAQE